MVRKIIILVFSMFLWSCDSNDLVGFVASSSDDVDTRFRQSHEYTGDCPLKEIHTEAQYVFYVCSDVHVENSTDNLDNFVMSLRHDSVASFALMLGDCVETKGAMSLFTSALEFDPSFHENDHPVFVTTGNHDTYFSQWNDFMRLLGPSAYWFEVCHEDGTDLFIALDSAGAVFGKKQLNWLNNLLDSYRDGYRRCVVFTHTNVFASGTANFLSGGYSVEETLLFTELMDVYDVDVVFQGHFHQRQDIVYRDVRYTLVGSLADREDNPEYLKVCVSSDGLDYEWVCL